MAQQAILGARRARKIQSGKRRIGLLFLLPSILLIVFSNLIPFVWNTILSFQSWDGYGPIEWVGFSNFAKVISEKNFWLSTQNSLTLGVFSSLITVLLGVVLAFCVFRFQVREGGAYRLVLFMPYLLPMSVIGLMFTFMLNYEYGVLNEILRFLGLGALAKPWLADAKAVMPVLILIRGWKGLGMTMLLCIAAMQAIPVSLFESARLDGASLMKTYLRIVIPLILPVIALSLLNTLMGSFKAYDVVKIMTNGGPGRASYVVPMLMMDHAFKYNKFGYAASMGSVFTLIVLAVIALANLLIRSEKYEY